MSQSPEQEKEETKSNYRDYCVANFGPPVCISFNQLLEARATDIVAGHGGLLTTDPSHCLKPMNPNCLRSRREQLFYQMVNFFQTNRAENLRYRDFPLLTHPDKQCDCIIDWQTFNTIKRFIPKFFHVKHLITEGQDFDHDEAKKNKFFDAIYSDDTWCPCYGVDRRAKDQCSVNYDQVNFICMEDLHAHCRMACILDVKMGRITHDPMANEQKIHEQTYKYPRLRDFGFRLLGMKNSYVTRDKEFGKTLASQEQVFEAIESFFDPLQSCDRKCAVISRMLDILRSVLEWFETMNNNQIRFYSSSILFVYDAALCDSVESSDLVCARLAGSVRVSMIDFAHVFHSHDLQEGPSRSGSATSIRTSESLNKDDNYLYGLRRLVKFFIMLNRQQRAQVAKIEEQQRRIV